MTTDSDLARRVAAEARRHDLTFAEKGLLADGRLVELVESLQARQGRMASSFRFGILNIGGAAAMVAAGARPAYEPVWMRNALLTLAVLVLGIDVALIVSSVRCIRRLRALRQSLDGGDGQPV